MLKQRLCVYAILLTLLSRPAIAQQRASGALVPSVGVGSVEEIGPHLQLGLQLQRRFGETLVGTIQAAAWHTIAVTSCQEPGGRDCPTGGTSADVGINAQGNSSGTVRPYLGVGGGGISMRGWSPALNTRAGVAIGPRRGAQLHVEFRVQRIFRTAYTVNSVLTAGVGIGW